MRRAAQAARLLALQTNTAIVLVEHGKPVRIAAEQLRRLLAADADAEGDAALMKVKTAAPIGDGFDGRPR